MRTQTRWSMLITPDRAPNDNDASLQLSKKLNLNIIINLAINYRLKAKNNIPLILTNCITVRLWRLATIDKVLHEPLRQFRRNMYLQRKAYMPSIVAIHRYFISI